MEIGQTICIKSFDSDDQRVRANAALGLAYIARTKGQLEKHLVKPMLVKELRENIENRWRIIDAITDINCYLGWQPKEKPLAKNKAEYSQRCDSVASGKGDDII